MTFLASEPSFFSRIRFKSLYFLNILQLSFSLWNLNFQKSLTWGVGLSFYGTNYEYYSISFSDTNL